MNGRIDLNADLGESFGRWRLGDDEALLAVVSSANVACGFHAGDPATLARTCVQAAAAGVVVGAQVGYPDLAGFGRRFLDMDADDLTAAVLYQIGALDGLARAAGIRVRYVKPHGALYNTVVTHERQAAAVVAAVCRYDSSLPVLGLPGSALLALATGAGLRAVPEAFADRGYDAAGRLVDRRQPGALVTDPAVVAARAVAMASGAGIDAVDGTHVPVQAESLCVHGDSPNAAASARAVRAALDRAGLTVTGFVADGVG